MEYLHESTDNFLRSNMFIGDRPYQQMPNETWFEWIYIAAFDGYTTEENTGKVKFKIGQTQDLQRRNSELQVSNDTQLACSIIYAWSVPKSKVFELDIKHFLKHFIHPESMVLLGVPKYKTEIVWELDIVTLIKIIRVCILYTCVEQNFVPSTLRQQMILRNLMHAPNTIKYGRELFYGSKHAVKNTCNIRDMYREIEEEFQQVGLLNQWCENARQAYFDLGVTTMTDKYLLQYIFGDITADGIIDFNDRIANTRDSDILYTDKVLQKPAALQYDVNSYIYAKYEDTYYPAQVDSYGIGPNYGAYYVRWLAYKFVGADIYPRVRNGEYYAHRNQNNRETYDFVYEVKNFSDIYITRTPRNFRLRF